MLGQLNRRLEARRTLVGEKQNEACRLIAGAGGDGLSRRKDLPAAGLALMSLKSFFGGMQPYDNLVCVTASRSHCLDEAPAHCGGPVGDAYGSG